MRGRRRQLHEPAGAAGDSQRSGAMSTPARIVKQTTGRVAERDLPGLLGHVEPLAAREVRDRDPPPRRRPHLRPRRLALPRLGHRLRAVAALPARRPVRSIDWRVTARSAKVHVAVRGAAPHRRVDPDRHLGVDGGELVARSKCETALHVAGGLTCVPRSHEPGRRARRGSRDVRIETGLAKGPGAAVAVAAARASRSTSRRGSRAAWPSCGRRSPVVRS